MTPSVRVAYHRHTHRQTDRQTDRQPGERIHTYVTPEERHQVGTINGLNRRRQMPGVNHATYVCIHGQLASDRGREP